jgi:hypothetical protein
LASNAAPITVTASARRSNTLAGNSTWVRPQPVHLARRGVNRWGDNGTLGAEHDDRSRPPAAPARTITTSVTQHQHTTVERR